MSRLATLQQWEELGIKGKVHVGKPGLALPYKKKLTAKIEKAIATINKLHESTRGCWYVSLSFGVDSLVAYHLAKAIFCSPKAVWVNQGKFAEWSDCLALKEVLVQEGMHLVELEPDTTLYEWYQKHGIPLGASMSNTADKALNEALMYAPIRRFNEQEGMKGHAWGLRANGESRHRGMLISKRGELYQRIHDGFWVASPVARWTKAEIFAYIDLHQLPYPAMYDLNREEIRNGPPIGATACNLGRIAQLKAYFPQVYRVFVTEFPEITRFQ